MRKEAVVAAVMATVVVTALAGCASGMPSPAISTTQTAQTQTTQEQSSATGPAIVGSEPLSGDAAQAAMLAVLDASISSGLANGLTEQHTIGDTEFVLVFDPTAPDGAQVAGMDSRESVAIYDTPAALSLNKVKTYLDAVGDSLGTVTYDGSSFTIGNGDSTIVLIVANNLIEGSAITAGGSSTPQLVAITYSLNDVAREILRGAVPRSSAPAQ